MYKPSGPDGRGWGAFRENSKTEEIIIEELEQMQLQDKMKKERLALMSGSLKSKSLLK